MANDKISILLPTYNGEKFLASAVESVLAQSYQNWELIIADDCSSDRSRAIASEYAQRDKRIVYIVNERNVGLFANYNVCIAAASGHYIKPFAQDDMFEPACLESLVQALRSTPEATLVTAARTVIDDTGAALAIERFYDGTKLILGSEVIASYVRTFVYKTGTPAQVMFRRENIGTGFDTTYFLSGDIEYFFRILESGHYLYLDEPLVRFRRHDSSATAYMLKDMSFVSDSFRLLAKYRHFLADAHGKTPLVHKPLIEGLIRKINNATQARNITYEESVVLGTNQDPGNKLNFEYPAYQLLLYCAEQGLTVDKLTAEVSSLQQQLGLLDNKLAGRTAESEQLKSRLQELDRRIETLQKSPSWRLTAPFRRLMSVLRSS